MKTTTEYGNETIVYESDRERADHHRELVSDKLGAENYERLIMTLFGQNGHDNDGLFERKVYGQCVWDDSLGVYRTYPSVRSADISAVRQGCASKEQKRSAGRGRLNELALTRHFLATDKARTTDEFGYGYVWYVNACICVNGQTLLLLKLDIDCHAGQDHADALESAEKLASLFGLKPSEFYLEPSTNGRGVHLYVLTAWAWNAGPEQIASDILTLERELAVLTRDWSAPCSEIKGKPLVYESDRSVKSLGNWAKAPRPSNPSEASELLAALSHSSDFSDLLAGAREHCRSAHPRWRSDTATAFPSPSARITEGGRREGTKGIREETAIEEHQTGNENTENGDTFARVNGFTPGFMRQFFNENDRLPNLEELTGAYEKAGKNTGNSDGRCLADAHRRFTDTFVPDKAKKKGVVSAYPDALRFISSAIQTNGPLADVSLDNERRKRNAKVAGKNLKNVTKLNRFKLAQALACMAYELGDKPDRTGTFGKEQFVSLIKLVYGREPHGNEFRASMRWLRRNGFCQILQYHRASANRTGQCRTYKLTLPS